MIVKIREGVPPPAGLSSLSTYVVVALIAYGDGRIEVRILSDNDGVPALYRLADLDIVNGDIPADWCVVNRKNGAIEILPKEWAYSDFWLHFFDGDADAELAFKRYFSGTDQMR